MQRGLPIAKQDARGRSRCTAMSWGVMHFLIRCDREGLSRIGRRLFTERSISRSLIAPLSSEREFRDLKMGVSLLNGTLMEQLAGAREMQRRKVTLNSLGLRQNRLQVHCQIALRSLGVIRHVKLRNKDYIREILATLYNCGHSAIWRFLLDTEYEHALQILTEAQSRFTVRIPTGLGCKTALTMW